MSVHVRQPATHTLIQVRACQFQIGQWSQILGLGGPARGERGNGPRKRLSSARVHVHAVQLVQVKLCVHACWPTAHLAQFQIGHSLIVGHTPTLHQILKFDLFVLENKDITF